MEKQDIVNELSKEYLISFYNQALQLNGDNPEALRWTSKGQLLHYNCLLDIAPNIDDKKIFCFGFGKGGFL